MRSTLFFVPTEVGGWPLFGFGLLFWLWLVGSVGLVAVLVRRQGWNSDTRSYVPVLLLLGATIAFLLPAIAEERGLPIRGYGAMLLVAVASGVALAAYRARRLGIDHELIFSLAFWLFIAGIVGARLFYVIEYWEPLFAGQTLKERLIALVAINSGGLVVYGALICGGLALVAFIHAHRLPGLALTDLIAPSVVLGLGLGRLGCFLNGCCFGGLCDQPWAVEFPADSPPHEQQIRLGQVYGLFIGADAQGRPLVVQVERGTAAAEAGLQAGASIQRINGHSVPNLNAAQRELLAAFATGGTLDLDTAQGSFRILPLPGTQQHSRPIHPTQLYSALDAFLLCGFLLAYYPFRRRDGEVTALTLTIHPISRFLLEIIRTDEAPVFGTGLSISQNISLLILLGAVGLWFYLARRPRGSVYPQLAVA